MDLVKLFRIEEAFRLVEEEFMNVIRFTDLRLNKAKSEARRKLFATRLVDAFAVSRLSDKDLIISFRVDETYCSAKFDMIEKRYISKEVNR